MVDDSPTQVIAVAADKPAAPEPGLLVRWLRGAWPAWIALLLLVVGMEWFIAPRIALFMDYWYSVPADSAVAAQADEWRQAREQAALHRAWLIGAAPVALLFVLQFLFALFEMSRAGKKVVEKPVTDNLPAKPASSGDAIEFESVGLNIKASDITVIRGPGALDNGAIHIGQGGRYRIERLIASGGMGLVHKGFDKTLHRDVAVKELDVGLAQDQEQTDRFRQEARALAGLAHPNIVPVYDLVEDRNRFWIVMELLSGGDLDRFIEQNVADIKKATSIIRSVAEGLAFAHSKGIVHRDIKPMNILFSGDGIPKLVDFGIAKLVQSQQSVVHTREGLSLGSPTYMSPEQAEGRKTIDNRADIYALGITFYRMLTGEVPFSGDVVDVMRQQVMQLPRPPREINPAITESLEKIILKMLEKNPEDRYQTLEAFIADLDKIRSE